MPIDCSTMASSPAVTCSPVATTASYSRASCRGEASRTQATSWLVTPAMAETTTATLLPASTSRLTWRATLRMRSTLATEVPPNFITTTAISVSRRALRECAGVGLKGCPPQPGEPGPKGLQTAMSEQKSRLRPVLLTASAGPRNIRALTIFAKAAISSRPMQAEPSVLSADPTLDPREVERFGRLAGAMVGPQRQVPPAASAGAGAAALHPRRACAPLRAPCRRRPADRSQGFRCSTSAAAAGSSPSRSPGSERA